ncbi:hypothetical protein LPUS_09732 [Lasallia pustulata]|uniref:Uncharacterized protein n=1 Tax=Lasallia pustulata TaxID=136370 RepID=A0A1W5D8B3_9LECA|nr:hypothetical protein LPUS_09732 [Lasallia pustulata]
MASPSNRERFPELYNQTNIDRRTCTRVVPMRVLVLGMMRTGTMFHAQRAGPTRPRARLPHALDHPQPDRQHHVDRSARRQVLPQRATVHALWLGPTAWALRLHHRPALHLLRRRTNRRIP